MQGILVITFNAHTVRSRNSRLDAYRHGRFSARHHRHGAGCDEPARVLVEDASHPATGIREPFTLEEEFYTVRDNPRGRVHVLLRLDPASVNTTGDYPLAWGQSFGGGRSYYNALGHFPATWRDARFQNQLMAAIRWSANK